MTAQPPTSIVSGVEYAVSEVAGRPPAADADFGGELELHVVYAPPGAAVRQDHVLRGVGLLTDGGIFFNEKDDHGKDVRRWKVARSADGGYVARQGLF